MIDRTKPLTEQAATDLRALIDALRGNRERYRLADRRVEVRSCDLEIAEATRALAILNRRATEAEDQRVADGQALTAERVREAVRVSAGALLDERKLYIVKPVQPTMNDIVLEAYGHGRACDAAALQGDDLQAVLADLATRVAEKLAGRAVAPAQREAELREAFVAGCQFAVGRVRVTDSGAGPSLDTPTVGDEDDAAAEYSRGKAGG